ncbi:J domain-containing protein CG6693-like [Sitodiplosis mosellana]|uniref:J domain-containing protein CG6693-like n=1 Tax=Sitodiplosis mosellana TaxID=263140 RepID=UPI0024447CD0|nr:J domain-containing protein CG6693-like [Sitodiplosis mosellana]
MNAEKYFQTRNLYEILQITPKAKIQEVKKSYYKLARIFHPDRAADFEKNEACEKLNIIHNAYSILSDPMKKRMYDEGSNILFSKVTIAARWKHYLKPVDLEDIQTARNGYRGSNAEELDLIREFIAGNGSLTHLLNTIPFMRVEDED